MSTYVYLSNLLKDRYVASVMPTPRFVVEKICDRIDLQDARVVVEFGPGTGVFTHAMLQRMSPDARLIAIERNVVLFNYLKRSCRDTRLRLFNDCAGNIAEIVRTCGAQEVDCVVSGIPFSLLPTELRVNILNNTHSILKQNGKFFAYQTFYQAPRFLRKHLQEMFFSVKTDYAVLNLPPLLLVEATK